MFEDLLQANRRYATSAPREFDGYAHARIAVVTCMDSRLLPLHMIGLFVGEAKILRTPGAHFTPVALNGCILGVRSAGFRDAVRRNQMRQLPIGLYFSAHRSIFLSGRTHERRPESYDSTHDPQRWRRCAPSRPRGRRHHSSRAVTWAL